MYHEGVGSNNIEHGNSQELLGIVGAGILENLSSNRHRGVDRITDQVNNGVRTALDNPLAECSNNPSIDIEQIISSHPRFPWNSGRNDHEIHPDERALELLLP